MRVEYCYLIMHVKVFAGVGGALHDGRVDGREGQGRTQQWHHGHAAPQRAPHRQRQRQERAQGAHLSTNIRLEVTRAWVRFPVGLNRTFLNWF